MYIEGTILFFVFILSIDIENTIKDKQLCAGDCCEQQLNDSESLPTVRDILDRGDIDEDIG